VTASRETCGLKLAFAGADKSIEMRRLLIRLIVFIAVIEALGRLDFIVLLSALALAIAGIVCTDLLFTSLSSRVQ
jgi:hypothetical protein